MFSGVTPARRSASLSRLGTAGLKTSSPSFAVRLTSVPAPNPTSSAKPRGILTPRLFPHFWTFVCTPELRLYAEYTTIGIDGLCPHLSNARHHLPAESCWFGISLGYGKLKGRVRCMAV